MKKLTLLIVLLCNISFAQDARIFQNTWYLTNIIDNGVNNYPPSGNIDLNFYSVNNLRAYSGCNVSMMGMVVFENNTTNFSGSNFVMTLNGWCSDQNLQNYGWYYFNFFAENDPPMTRFFTYNITENGSQRTLVINSAFNSFGKQAIYSNVQMANKQFDKNDFKLIVNNNFLEIDFANEISSNSKLMIYDQLGKMCKQEFLKSNNSKIDINDLSNGIYFVKINVDDEVVTKKFVKL